VIARHYRNYGHDESVDLGDPGSIRHFTRALGCSERQLREAIALVGPRRADLRRRFRARPMTRSRAA
jgi:hypothetical protein